jgi:hypothetical protein
MLAFATYNVILFFRAVLLWEVFPVLTCFPLCSSTHLIFTPSPVEYPNRKGKDPICDSSIVPNLIQRGWVAIDN